MSRRAFDARNQVLSPLVQAVELCRRFGHGARFECGFVLGGSTTEAEFLLKDLEGSQAVMLLRKPRMQLVHVSLFESHKRSHRLIQLAKVLYHSEFFITTCSVVHPARLTTSHHSASIVLSTT